MFEFMHKYRMPILVVIFVGMVGFGAWGAIQGMFGGGIDDKQLALFSVPGETEKVELRTMDFINAERGIRRIDRALYFYGRDGKTPTANLLGLGDKDPASVTYDFMIMAKAAKAAGVRPSPEQIETMARSVLRVDKDDKLRLSDELRDFFSDFLAAQTWRQQYMSDPAGPTFSEMYETYKNEHVTLKGRYVQFVRPENDAFPLDITKKEDRDKLEEWFNKNLGFKRQNQIQEQVDLSVAYVRLADKSVGDFEKEFNEKWAALSADITIDEAAVAARYEAHQALYDELAALERKDEKPVEGEEQKTALEWFKANGHITRELKVAELVKKFGEEVAADASKFDELAAKYKLATATPKGLDREKLEKHPEIGGSRVLSAVFEMAVPSIVNPATATTKYALGDLVPDAGGDARFMTGLIDQPRKVFAQVRVLAHRPTRDPEFKEVVGEAKTAWQEFKARTALNTAGTEFKEAVDNYILALPELKEKVDAAKKSRDEKVAKAITDQKLDPEKEADKARIENLKKQYEYGMKAELAADMKPHQAKAFEAVAKEKGLSIGTLGPIRKSDCVRPSFPEGLSKDEKQRRLLRSMNIINSLSFAEEGTLSVALRDPGVQDMSTMVLLDEKKFPPESELLAYPTRVATLRQRMAEQPDRNWNFELFQKPEWFGLSAPEHSKRLANDAEREATRQELKRLAQEKRNKARQARIEAARKAAADANPKPDPKDGVVPPKSNDDAVPPKPAPTSQPGK